MFVYSILDFWGMSEDLPFVYKPGSQERYDWCIAQELTKRKDFTAFLETGVGAELAGGPAKPSVLHQASRRGHRRRQKGRSGTAHST